MSHSVVEQIAAQLAAEIDAITVSNGFTQDLTAIRPRRLDFSGILLNDGKVFIWQGDREPAGEPVSMCDEWLQTFTIGAILIDSDDESDSIDTRLNDVASDIEKKLKADVTRGQLAVDTFITQVEKIDTEENTGVLITVIVHYRTAFNDPYTLG